MRGRILGLGLGPVRTIRSLKQTDLLSATYVWTQPEMPWSPCVDISSAGLVYTSGWRPDRPDRSVPSARRASARRRSSLSTAGGTPREIRGEQLVVCQYFVSDIAERRSHPDLRARDRSPQLTTLSRALGLEEDSRVEAFTCPSASVLFHLDSLHPTSTSGRSALEPLGQDLTRLWKRHFCIKFSSGWLLRLYFGC